MNSLVFQWRLSVGCGRRKTRKGSIVLNCRVTDEYCVLADIISPTEKKTIDAVLRKINCRDRLLDILNRRKLKFIGHVMRSESLEKNLLTGMIKGKRGKRQTEDKTERKHQRYLWADDGTMERKAQDRAEWRRMERFTATQS